MKPMQSILVKTWALSITLTLLLVNPSEVWSQVCANPNTFIYGLTSAANVHRINATNAGVGPRMNPLYGGNAPSYSNAMGYNNANGRFYYFKRNSYVAPQ